MLLVSVVVPGDAPESGAQGLEVLHSHQESSGVQAGLGWLHVLSAIATVTTCPTKERCGGHEQRGACRLASRGSGFLSQHLPTPAAGGWGGVQQIGEEQRAGLTALPPRSILAGHTIDGWAGTHRALSKCSTSIRDDGRPAAEIRPGQTIDGAAATIA
jgi:hypothetical protein